MTSILRVSVGETATFMSLKNTLVCTRAPASLQDARHGDLHREAPPHQEARREAPRAVTPERIQRSAPAPETSERQCEAETEAQQRAEPLRRESGLAHQRQSGEVAPGARA